MVERTCIVTRKCGPPEDLIRFVAGPDGTVVPDLKAALPGRGAWVSARASLVERAATVCPETEGFGSVPRAQPRRRLRPCTWQPLVA